MRFILLLLSQNLIFFHFLLCFTSNFCSVFFYFSLILSIFSCVVSAYFVSFAMSVSIFQLPFLVLQAVTSPVSFQNHLTHYSNLDQNLAQLAKPGDFFNLSPVGTVSSCKLRS